MPVKFVCDVLLPTYGWLTKSVLDPLHPIYGPPPELTQIWADNDQQFLTAVWLQPTCAVVMVDPIDNEIPESSWRLRIMQTFLWKYRKNCAKRQNIEIPLPEVGDWREFCMRLFQESVKLAGEPHLLRRIRCPEQQNTPRESK